MFKTLAKYLIIASTVGASIPLTTFNAGAVDIPANRLAAAPLTLQIVPGKATTLHFQNGEIIDNFVISDDSQLIYNTNQPPGKAQTLILRQINSLKTPGSTHTSRPNIIISTRATDGSIKVYQVIVEFVKSVSPQQLLWRVVAPSYRPDEQTIETATGTANLKHLQKGLNYLLETGQVSSSDAIVGQFRALFTLAGQMPLTQAAISLNIPPDALAKLGEIGLKVEKDALNFLFPLVQQLPPPSLE